MGRSASFKGWLWIGIGIGLCALLTPVLAHSLLEAPFGRDQGIFLWQAQVLRSGGMPYLDAWDHKGPLVPVLYALAGGTHTGVRLLDLAFFLLTLGALALCWPDRLAGVLAAAVFFCFLTPNWWSSAQPDLWASEWIVWGLVLSRYPGRLSALGMGALLGLTTLIKPVYILPAAVFGFCFLHAAWSARRPGAGARLVLFMAGGAVPCLITLIWLIHGGALKAMLDAVVTFNLTSHVPQPETTFGIFPPLAQLFVSGSLPVHPLVSTLFGLVLLGALWRTWRGGARLTPAVWLAAWLTMVVQHQGISYHYFPHLAVMAVVLGNAGAHLVRRLNPEPGSGTNVLLLAVIGIAATHNTFFAPNTYVSPGDGFNAQALQETAEAVRQRTRPDDTVYLWGYDAGLFPLSERRSASRYGHNHALLIGDPTTRRADLMAELKRASPRAIVVQRGDHNGPDRKDSQTLLAGFPALAALIRADYHASWQNTGFLLYLKNASP